MPHPLQHGPSAYGKTAPKPMPATLAEAAALGFELSVDCDHCRIRALLWPSNYLGKPVADRPLKSILWRHGDCGRVADLVSLQTRSAAGGLSETVDSWTLG